MNRIKIKLIIAIIPFLALACDTIYIEDQKDLDYFMKLYGNYYGDYLSDIKIAQNEDIFLTGYRLNANNQEESWLIKTSANGMVEWEKVIKSNSNCRGYGLYIDESIFYAGYKKGEAKVQQGFLLEYNLNGNRIDSIPFNISADDVKDIKFISNKTNLKFLVHLVWKGKEAKDEIILYEYNKTSGITELSTNQLFGSIEGRLYFVEDENDDLYITGSVNEDTLGVNKDIMVARLVNNSIIWSFNYGDPENSELSSGIIIKDNKLLIASTILGGTSNQISILTLNQSGIEEGKINVDLDGKRIAYNMILNSAGEFVFAGESEYDKDAKIFMARVSWDGSLVLKKEYGNLGVCKGRFVINLPGNNKGFLLAGDMSTSNSLGSSDVVDVIVVKVNELGDWIY